MEDIFSKWINKAIEYPAGIHVGTPRLTTMHEGRAPKTISVPKPGTRATGVAGICTRCNNEWMSRVEVSARPLLTPMINGHETQLTPAEQLTVARWACVKACAYEADPRRAAGRFSTIADRDALRTDTGLPVDMAVTLAAYDVALTFVAMSPYGVGTGEQGQPLAQWLTTFVLGHLVIQVFGRGGSTRPSVLAVAPEGIRNAHHFSVWPPQPTTVSWPPARVLTPDDIVAHCTGPHEPWARSVAEVFAQRPENEPCAHCGESHGPFRRDLPVPVTA